MLNGNSFSLIKHFLSQNESKEVRNGLPGYYPTGIPLDFYQLEPATDVEAPLTRAEYQEMAEEQNREKLENSQIGQKKLLPWFYSEQNFISIITSSKTLEQKIADIQNFIETKLWDNQEEIPFHIDDQHIAGFRISPAFVHEYLTYWQQKIEKNDAVAAEIKDQIKSLCENVSKKLQEQIAQQDIKTFQAIAVDSLYIAASLADGSMSFNNLRERLVYYYGNCSSDNFRILIGKISALLKNSSNIEKNELINLVADELQLWFKQQIEQKRLADKQSKGAKKAEDSSTVTKVAAVVTSALVVANQIVPSAANEYTINTKPGNATNPGLTTSFPDGSFPVDWVSQLDGNVYSKSIFPQNGTTTTATEFRINAASPIYVDFSTLEAIQCSNSTKFPGAATFYSFIDQNDGSIHGFVQTYNSTARGTEYQLSLPIQPVIKQRSSVFSDKTVVVAYQDQGQVKLQITTCDSFNSINRTSTVGSGASPSVATSLDQSFFWATWTALQSGFKRIVVQPFNKMLVSQASSIAVSSATNNSDNSFLAPKNSTAVVSAWEQQNGSVTEVMGAVVTKNGATQTASSPFSLSSTSSSGVHHTQPKLQKLSDGTFVCGFVETNTTTNLSKIVISRVVVNSNGTISFKNNGNRVVSEDATKSYTNLAMQLTPKGDGVVLAYECQYDGIAEIRVKQLSVLGFNIIQNALTIYEGQTKLLTSEDLAATEDGDALDSITFNFSSLSSSTLIEVYNGTSWDSATSCTQEQIKQGHVRVTHDGSEVPVAYQVSAYNGTTMVNSTSEITYIPLNDSPVIVANSLGNVSNSQTYNLTSENLGILDPDNTPSQITVMFSNLSNMIVEVFNGLSWIVQQGLSFTVNYSDIINNYVRFTVPANSTSGPFCTILVSDGTNETVANMTASNFIFVPSPSATPSVTPTPSTTPTPSVTPSSTASPTMKPSAVVKHEGGNVSTTAVVSGVVGAIAGTAALTAATLYGVFRHRESKAIKAAEQTRHQNGSEFANALYTSLNLNEPKEIRNFTSKPGIAFQNACQALRLAYFEEAKSIEALCKRYMISEGDTDFNFAIRASSISQEFRDSRSSEGGAIPLSTVTKTDRSETVLDKVVEDVVQAIKELGYLQTSSSCVQESVSLANGFYNNQAEIVRTIISRYGVTNSDTPTANF